MATRRNNTRNRKGHQLKVVTLALYGREPMQMTLGDGHGKVGDLFEMCNESIPKDSEIRVNNRAANPTTTLRNNDLVTAFPSVSGGRNPTPFSLFDYRDNHIGDFNGLANVLSKIKLPKGFRKINLIRNSNNVNPPTSEFNPDEIHIFLHSAPFVTNSRTRFDRRKFTITNKGKKQIIILNKVVDFYKYNWGRFDSLKPFYINDLDKVRLATVTNHIIHLHFELFQLEPKENPALILQYILNLAMPKLSKPIRLKSLAVLKQRLQDLMNKKMGERIATIQLNIDTQNKIAKDYRKEYLKNIKRANDFEQDIVYIKKSVQSKGKASQIINSIRRIKEVKDIAVYDDRLEVFTNPLKIREKKSIRRYNIGRYLMIFYYDGHYYVKNLDKPMDSNYDHPCIQNGICCFGNMYELDKYATTGQYDIAVQGLLHFLQGYDEKGGPHLNLKRWLEITFPKKPKKPMPNNSPFQSPNVRWAITSSSA